MVPDHKAKIVNIEANKPITITFVKNEVPGRIDRPDMSDDVIWRILSRGKLVPIQVKMLEQ